MTVIVITHNSALTPMADRIVRIRNGRVAGGDTKRESNTGGRDRMVGGEDESISERFFQRDFKE